MYIIKESEDEAISTIVDILNMNSLTNEQKIKYIQLLKNKYNYIYKPLNDDDLIKNASLDNIKSIDSFSNYTKFQKYAIEIFLLRNYHPSWKNETAKGTIAILELEDILKQDRFPIKVELRKSSASNSAEARSNTIIIDEITAKSIVIHELGHVVQNLVRYSVDKPLCNIVNAPSLYGAKNAGECFAEGFLHFFEDKNYSKEFSDLLPEWKKITDPYRKLVQNIIGA